MTRAQFRQAWGCDCEGPPDGKPDASRYAEWIRRVKQEVEEITGYPAPTCPWRAFESPIVRDVIRAHAFFESGQLREFWGDDPPRTLVEGVRVHEMAIRLTEQADREAERKRREAMAAARGPMAFKQMAQTRKR